MTKPRNRGTALVETPQGILVALEGNGKNLLLPGGGVERDESGLEAAVRELYEEARLKAVLAVPLFRFNSSYNQHFVYYVRATGEPARGRGVKYLGGYKNGQLTPIVAKSGFETLSADQLSPSVLAIIKLYEQRRQEASAWFAALDGSSDFQDYTYADVDKLR